MLTSVQAAHARRFTTSPRGGFSVPAVDALRARVAATLASHEATGTPGRGGLTADELSQVVLPSVITEPGYALLEVQDFLDEAHEALAAFEQRAAASVPTGWGAQPTWSAQPAPAAAAPAASALRTAPAPQDRPHPQDRPLPRNVTPAIRALASVGAPRPEPFGAQAVAPRALAAVRDAAVPDVARPVPAPARPYGMDADALVFELQQAVSRSRARGTLQVSVQVPGQQLRVMRVVETTPGSITIIAQ